jgi:RNA polymerase primary sigma factor
MEQESGDAVSWMRVADDARSDDEQSNEISALHIKVSSLDSAVGDEDLSLSDVLCDAEAPSPSDLLEASSCRTELLRAMNGLELRERMIISKFFGLDMEERRTLEEIGLEYKLTRERIRQIKDRALRKLRHFSRSQALRDYLGK